MFTTIMSIIEKIAEVTAPEVEFDAIEDFPNPFDENIEDQPSFDPPHIDVQGDLGDNLRVLVNKFADSAFRSALPPEPAKILPFEIEFAEIYRHPCRLSPKYDEVLRSAVDDLIRQKLAIRSFASSASPIVMAAQKDKVRMCIDYRELNGSTKKMRYPLPNPTSIFLNLAGNKFFGQLDLRFGYHQLAMSNHASEWSAFITPFGQYRFLRVPFGLANARGLVLNGYVGNCTCWISWCNMLRLRRRHHRIW